MLELVTSIGWAFWLGILTSISPCPLATNIAAISFLGKRVDNPRAVLLGGMFYTFGRMFTYVALGVLLVSGILAAPQVAGFLDRHLNRILGPLLIVVGMFLLQLISFSIPGSGRVGEWLRNKAQASGLWGAWLLGVVFALSFCPTSAVLFFGSLLTIALAANSPVLIPLVYGVGTAVPVFVFAFLVGMGAKKAAQVFNKLTRVEKWARWITGVIFILVGLFFTLVYIFGVL